VYVSNFVRTLSYYLTIYLCKEMYHVWTDCLNSLGRGGSAVFALISRNMKNNWGNILIFILDKRPAPLSLFSFCDHSKLGSSDSIPSYENAGGSHSTIAHEAFLYYSKNAREPLLMASVSKLELGYTKIHPKSPHNLKSQRIRKQREGICQPLTKKHDPSSKVK
jgi:hypothetical protein